MSELVLGSDICNVWLATCPNPEKCAS
jgi:hypothetical protein